MWVIGRGFAPTVNGLTVGVMSLCRVAYGRIVEDHLNYNNRRELLLRELVASFSRS